MFIGICEVEILKRDVALMGTHSYQTPNAQIFEHESAMRSKFVLQKGKSPDHRLRSPIFAKWERKWNCLDS